MHSRRDFLGLAAMAAGSTLFSGRYAAFAATPRGTLVLAQTIDDVSSLDPAGVYSFSTQEVTANIYDRIMRYDATDLTQIEGGVAESWSVSPDAKTYQFRIRPGQKFHSGNPLTAEDAAWSLQRAIILDNAPARMFRQLGWTVENVGSLIEATDPQTLKFRITEDLAPSLVLNVMTTIVASVIDKKVALEHEDDNDLGSAWLKTNSAGSGAYRLVAWEPNESITLTANPEHYLGAANNQRVVIRHIPEAATQRLLLERADIDVARTLSADQLAPLVSNDSIKIESFPASTLFNMGINLSDETLKNPKVVQAIKLLVDYEGMVNSILKGQFFVHQTFLPKGFLGSVAYNPWKLDVARAKELLADAGYPEGFETELVAPNAPPWPAIAQSIQHTMGQGGIKVKLMLLDTKQTRTIVRERRHKIFAGTYAPDYFDPQSYAIPYVTNDDDSDTARNKGYAWRMHWYIPEMTKAVAAAASEVNTEKRATMYEDLAKKVTDEGPFVWMFQNINRIAIRATVEDFRLGLFEDLNTYRTARK